MSWVQCPLRKKQQNWRWLCCVHGGAGGASLPFGPFAILGQWGVGRDGRRCRSRLLRGVDRAPVLGRTPGASRIPQKARDNYVDAMDASSGGGGGGGAPISRCRAEGKLRPTAVLQSSAAIQRHLQRPQSNCCLPGLDGGQQGEAQPNPRFVGAGGLVAMAILVIEPTTSRVILQI